MEGSQNTSLPSRSPRESAQSIALIAQFMQSSTNMSHVDEVFLWLSRAMVQHLGISVVQFWASQRYSDGRSQIELRAAASLNPLLSQQMGSKELVGGVVERLLVEKRNCTSLPVERIFPSLRVPLLRKYELRYWAGYFLEHQALLPPAMSTTAAGKSATPLNMIISIFTRDPLSPSLQRAVSFVTEQALRIIVNQGILSAPLPVPPTPVDYAGRSAVVSLAALIPHRMQRVEDFQAANPFANASIIADKNARRLFGFVDGQRNIATLSQLSQFDQKQLTDALRYLLQHQHIHLCNSEGKIIEDISFLLPPL